MIAGLLNSYRDVKDSANRLSWRLRTTFTRPDEVGYIPDEIADEIDRENGIQEQQYNKPERVSGSFAQFEEKLFAKLDKMNGLLGALVGQPYDEIRERSGGNDNVEQIESKPLRPMVGMLAGFGTGAGVGFFLSNFELKHVMHVLTGVKAFTKVVDGLKSIGTAIKRTISSIERTMRSVRDLPDNISSKRGRSKPKYKQPKTKIAKRANKFAKMIKSSKPLQPLFNGLRAIAKAAPVVAAIITPIIEFMESNEEIAELTVKYNNGELSEQEYRQLTVESVVGAGLDSVSILAGAALGGVLGGLGGSIGGMILGPVGAAVGGFIAAGAGGIVGATFGEFISDVVLKPILAPAIARMIITGTSGSIVSDTSNAINTLIKNMSPETFLRAIPGFNHDKPNDTPVSTYEQKNATLAITPKSLPQQSSITTRSLPKPNVSQVKSAPIKTTSSSGSIKSSSIPASRGRASMPRRPVVLINNSMTNVINHTTIT